MSTLTPTIALKKPDGSDPFLTQDFDDNYDKIDLAIKALQDQLAGGGGGGGGGTGGITQTQGDARYVRTVNGTGPDASGNVTVAGGSGGSGGGTSDYDVAQNYQLAHMPFSDHEGHNFGASMAAGASQTFTLCSTSVPAGLSGRLSYDGALQLGGGGSVGGTARTTDARVSFAINGVAALISGLAYRQYFPGLTNGGGYVAEMPFVTYRDLPLSNAVQVFTLTCTVTQASGAGLVYCSRARALLSKT